MKTILYNLVTDKAKGPVAGLGKALLFILSLAYSLIVRALRGAYRLRPYRLKCRVISVGNITLGGTGKTTVVEFIARYLTQQGHKVAILSRGYKRRSLSSDQGAGTFRAMGDEPYMLMKNLEGVPVIVDKNRIRGAHRAIREHEVDTVILDDGFEQWKLKKDLEVVAIDATNPFGNRFLLPRGVLREPLSSLAQADIFVVTKTNLNPHLGAIKEALLRINPAAPIIESVHSPMGFYELGSKESMLGPRALNGKTVALVSGIGDPASFETMMKGLGLAIGLCFRFPDHHAYTSTELQNIVQQARSKHIDTLVTTEKDAVRLDALRITQEQMRVVVVRIELQLMNNEKEFIRRLHNVYSL